MIEVDVPYSVKRKAQLQAKKIRPLRNSILRGKGNVYGMIGEIIVSDYLKAKKIHSFDFDLVKNDTKLEIKTKSCSSPPKKEYECSVSAANAKQDCDYYVFVRVHDEMKKAWILGAISRKLFFQKARFCKEGEVDSKSRLGWRFKADCFNVEIKDLIPIEKFLKVRKI